MKVKELEDKLNQSARTMKRLRISLGRVRLDDPRVKVSNSNSHIMGENSV